MMTNCICNLWDPSDCTAEGGAVSCDDGAVHQRMCELGSLREVVLLVARRLVHDTCEETGGLFLRPLLRFHTQYLCLQLEDIKTGAMSLNTACTVEPTCLLDVSAVFCVAGVVAGAHQVNGEGSEDVLVAHDEVRHDAVGSPVLLKDCVPLLHMHHRKYVRSHSSLFTVIFMILGLFQTCTWTQSHFTAITSHETFM